MAGTGAFIAVSLLHEFGNVAMAGGLVNLRSARSSLIGALLLVAALGILVAAGLEARPNLLRLRGIKLILAEGPVLSTVGSSQAEVFRCFWQLLIRRGGAHQYGQPKRRACDFPKPGSPALRRWSTLKGTADGVQARVPAAHSGLFGMRLPVALQASISTRGRAPHRGAVETLLQRAVRGLASLILQSRFP